MKSSWSEILSPTLCAVTAICLSAGCADSSAVSKSNASGGGAGSSAGSSAGGSASAASSGGAGSTLAGAANGGTAGGVAGPIRLECDYPASLSGATLEAVAYGNATLAANPRELIDASLQTLELQRTAYDADLAQLVAGVDAIDWDPTHDAALLTPARGSNVTLLPANATNSDEQPGSQSLAVLGRRGGTPYLVFASNPFRTDRNAAMDQLLANGVSWLTGAVAGGKLRVTLAQLDESYFFKDRSSTRTWLTERFDVSLNEDGVCDGDQLATCLAQGTDLLIVSQNLSETDEARAIAAEVGAAVEKGIPVLYLQHDGSMNELGDALLRLLQVDYAGDNYWSKLKVEALDPATLAGRLSPSEVALQSTLQHLASSQYDFSLATAQTDDKSAFESQFQQGASAVREMMNGFDRRAIDIFASCGNELPKLLALLGDRLRQDVHFPMTVARTPTAEFLRSYFADHAVYNTRRVVPEQPDRGNFDTRDLSQVSATNVDVKLTSRPHFRSAGVYALPGRPVTIRRLDKSSAKTAIFVNSLRDGATHEWDDEYFGYARPKFLQSETVPLEPGGSLVLTSPYGGPVQVSFDVSNVEVELAFENVGRHPHWSGPADDAEFARNIASHTYDWVEVATEAFELHSNAEHFAGTMKDPRWNTPALLAAAIERYSFDAVHVLAGFRGKGIESVPEIVDWAAARGFEIPLLDLVKHANMDQATCGNGCSGNPYDADWDFSPISHGDLHELGHSLQNSRFQLSHGKQQYQNHSVTNWSPFYAAARYFADHGGETEDWEVEHDQIFAELQAAYAAGERAGDFSEHMNDYFAGILAKGGDSGIRDNYSFFMQAMLMARSQGKLENGYHLVPRLHLLARAFDAATDSAETWEASRAKLGFGSFELDEAEELTNNDFMLVAMSSAVSLDFRDFFDMWGLETGDKARAEVAASSFPSVGRSFFALGPVDHYRGAMSGAPGFPQLTIDGATPWPASAK